MPTWNDLHTRVTEGVATPHHVGVDLGECHARIETNDDGLRRTLAEYVGPLGRAADGEEDIVVRAMQMPAPELGLPFVDWRREGGKKGRKDTYVDLDIGRALRKVRTGMQYLVGPERIVFGDCRKNYNQVINFLNAQHISWALSRGWVLCHAAAAQLGETGIAIAAQSGGGKSTLALTLMRHGAVYVSNDRLLVRRAAGATSMLGVAKRPRINPGTALNNPDLEGVMPDERAAALRELDRQELWDVEEKYDVDVPGIWGRERWRLRSTLQHVVLLNWDHRRHEPTVLTEAGALNDDTLSGLMKSPGPFHVDDGGRPAPRRALQASAYAPHLEGVRLHSLEGGVDFDRAADLLLRELT